MVELLESRGYHFVFCCMITAVIAGPRLKVSKRYLPGFSWRGTSLLPLTPCLRTAGYHNRRLARDF